MTVTMFDSIDVSSLPAGNYAYAGYVDGRFNTFPKLKLKFPSSLLLSIAVFARDDADCLDVELGDATPGQAPAWVKRQLGKGFRPCLYASVSVMDSMISILDRAGIRRSSVRLWSAHYGNGQHICGPATCKLMSVSADGTQWTDRARGISLDQSLLRDDFFATSGTDTGGAVVATAYQDVTVRLPMLQQGVSDSNLPHWYVHRLQAILNEVYGYPCSIDGVYGPKTADAVRQVQGKYGLIADGICGEKTWAKVAGG